jgi:hypothetical protein
MPRPARLRLAVILATLSVHTAAHAVGVALSLGAQSSHVLEFETASVTRALLGAEGRVAIRWRFNRFSLATSLGIQRYNVSLASPRRGFTVLRSSKSGGDHSIHLWWTLKGESEGTHFFAGPAFGISIFTNCSGDVCSAIGLLPALEAGLRTPLGEKSNVFVLATAASYFDGIADLTFQPRFVMGIEL